MDGWVGEMEKKESKPLLSTCRSLSSLSLSACKMEGGLGMEMSEGQILNEWNGLASAFLQPTSSSVCRAASSLLFNITQLTLDYIFIIQYFDSLVIANESLWIVF